MTSRLRAYRLMRGLIAAGLLAGPIWQAAFGPAHAQSTAQSTAESWHHPPSRSSAIKRIEAGFTRTYFHAGDGQLLVAGDLDAALKALYATHLFADVRIRRSGGISHSGGIGRSGGQVIVTVVENPTLGRVALEGNRKLKEEQFKTEMQSKSGGPPWRPIVQEDVARMVELYHRRGYFDARIEPKIIAHPDARADLVFEIHEGAKTGVKKILFAGNQAFSADQLKGAITTGESNLLSFLLDNDLYDPDRIEADRDLLRRYYLKHGYADIRVGAAVAEYDPAQKGIVITFTVEEGGQYRIGSVDLKSGTRRSDPAILRARLRPAVGESLRCRGGAAGRRGAVARGRPPRRPVRPGAAARRPRCRAPRRPPALCGRAGAAPLHRAHRHPRQQQDPRRRHQARVRHRGRRRLQPGSARARRAAPEESRILQDRQALRRARLGTGPGGHQCQRGGAVHRRFLDHGRLFDDRRGGRRSCRSESATSWDAATRSAPR